MNFLNIFRILHILHLFNPIAGIIKEFSTPGPDFSKDSRRGMHRMNKPTENIDLTRRICSSKFVTFEVNILGLIFKKQTLWIHKFFSFVNKDLRAAKRLLLSLILQIIIKIHFFHRIVPIDRFQWTSIRTEFIVLKQNWLFYPVSVICELNPIHEY